MKNTLKTLKIESIIMAALLIALGVVLLVWPSITTLALCITLGIMLIIQGVVLISSYFTEGLRILFRYNLILGLFSVAIGLFVCCRPDVLMELLPYIFGVSVMISGIADIQKSIDLRILAYPYWWTVLIGGILGIALGIVLLCDPFSASVTFIIFVGVSLIWQGVCALSDIIQISIRAKSADKYLDNLLNGGDKR